MDRTSIISGLYVGSTLHANLKKILHSPQSLDATQIFSDASASIAAGRAPNSRACKYALNCLMNVFSSSGLPAGVTPTTLHRWVIVRGGWGREALPAHQRVQQHGAAGGRHARTLHRSVAAPPVSLHV